MANQYDVLGKAPGLEELNKLSPKDVHLTIRGLNLFAQSIINKN